MSTAIRKYRPELLGLFVLFAVTLSVSAQPPSKIPVTRNPARQVPPFFGQVGLSIQQRESIYAIKAKHLSKLAVLEVEIAKLKEAMLSECETVLTDVQKELLHHRRALDNERRHVLKSKSGQSSPSAPKTDLPEKTP